MRTMFGVAGVVFGLMVAGFAARAADRPYVVERRGGEPIYGQRLTADATGNLRLTLEGNATRSFSRGRYLYAWVPMPRELKGAEKASGAAAVQKLDQLFNQYKYLGWGGAAAYYKGSIEATMKKYADAEQSFKEGLRYEQGYSAQSRGWEAKLKQGMIEALLAQKKFDTAEDYVRQLRTTDPALAAYVFNTRGLLLKHQGKKREALLQYLKTVVVFDPSIGTARQEAYREVVSLMREMKDPRAEEFAAQYKKEY